MMKFIALLFAIFLQIAAHGADSCKSFTEEFIARPRSKSSISEHRKYLSQAVDTQYITKYSLGIKWRSLTPEQRKKFYESFCEYIVRKYANKFVKHPSISHKIVDVRNDTKRKDICNVDVVITTVINGEQKDIPLGAVVSSKGNTFKIQDITFENVSMLQAHKQEIASLLNSKGFEGTIATLQEFIASEK